jgi:hypothetical protein
MGDAHRRGMDSVVAHLQAPEGCSEFLKEASQVTSMLVQPPKPCFFFLDASRILEESSAFEKEWVYNTIVVPSI